MSRPSTRVVIGVGLAIAAVAILVVSKVASTAPDGLTRVAADKGFQEAASHPSLFGGYTPATALLGAVVVLALVAGVSLLLRRRR